MAYGVSDTAIGSIFIDAEIAQLVEQRIRNAWVEGSSPFFGLIIWEAACNEPHRGAFAGSLSLLYWWNFPKEAWIWRHLSGTDI